MKILAAVIALILVFTASLCWNLESVASDQTTQTTAAMQSGEKQTANRAPALVPQKIKVEPNRAPAVIGLPVVADSMNGTNVSSTGNETAAVTRKVRAATATQLSKAL